DEVHVAGAGLLALAAAAGGLALARGLPAPDALLFFRASASGRSQSAELVHRVLAYALACFAAAAFCAFLRKRRPKVTKGPLVCSTSIRYLTFSTIPRIAGVSCTTRVIPRLVRPS